MKSCRILVIISVFLILYTACFGDFTEAGDGESGENDRHNLMNRAQKEIYEEMLHDRESSNFLSRVSARIIASTAIFYAVSTLVSFIFFFMYPPHNQTLEFNMLQPDMYDNCCMASLIASSASVIIYNIIIGFIKTGSL